MFTKDYSKPFHAAIGFGMLASIFMVAPAGAADSYDGHTFVRDSILNTWRPTSVASLTAKKVDAQEQARLMIVGTPASAAVGAVAQGRPALDGHEQARQLLLSQPQYRGTRKTVSLPSIGGGS
jgi:hypothetical protein